MAFLGYAKCLYSDPLHQISFHQIAIFSPLDTNQDEPPSKQSKVEKSGAKNKPDPQVPGTSAEQAETDNAPTPAKRGRGSLGKGRGRGRGRGKGAGRGAARNVTVTPDKSSTTTEPRTTRSRGRGCRIMKADGSRAPSRPAIPTSPPASFGTPSPFHSSSIPTTSTRSAVPTTSSASAGPSTSAANEASTSQNNAKKSGDEPDRLTESENLMEFTDTESKSTAEQMKGAAIVDPNISQDCLGSNGEEIETYPKVGTVKVICSWTNNTFFCNHPQTQRKRYFRREILKKCR